MAVWTRGARGLWWPLSIRLSRGDAIVVAIVMVVVAVSCNLAAEGGVSVAILPQSLSLPTLSVAAVLFPLLNVHRSTSYRPTPTLHGARPVYHHHCVPVRAPPHYLPLPPPTLVDC